MLKEPVEQIRTLIAAVRRRWFAAVALRAVGMGTAVAAVPALAGWIVYSLLAPTGGALLVLASAVLVLSIVGAAIVFARIERRPDDRRVARFIEERAEARPGAAAMNDCVVSAVQAMSLQGGSQAEDRAAFATLIVQSAARCLDEITPATVIPPRTVQRSAAIAIGGIVLLAGTTALTAPALSHAVQTARVRLFPQSVRVEVLPGDVRVVAGQPLRIRARVHAGDAALSRVRPHLVVSTGSEQRTVEMAAAGEGFEFAFESVDRTFQYKVTAGQTTSSQHTVTALFPPRVKRIDVHYTYPAFSGLAPRTEEDGGDIYAPAGTRVRLRIEADKPIAEGELAMTSRRAPLTTADPAVLHAEVVLSKDDSYRIRLTDRDGLRTDGDSEYFIRLMDDRPPDVRILRPSSDQGITPLEEVAIEARAEDDYGVASLELVYAVGGGKEQVVPFSRVTGGGTQRTGTHLLAAEDLKVRPGDVITYYARARDVGRGKRSTETRSDLFFLEVHPFNAEFEAAQSQASAGGGAGDPQIESLIDAQKEIISATWNVERRSGAGRSSDDIKAIAEAQADLKARAERVLAATRGRRGRGFAPERVQSPQPPAGGGASTVAAAVEAMTRAVEQLASGKTRDAITHEMAALNGLLQAQADVRRRQVTQQANASRGGGGNRQTQDLSALFDKELQRQQRTNYEQRSQIDERPQQQAENQDALDRIRDLARRQEEINRQQKEAAAMSAEERKRHLDRLTRDQQELQRQAEQLSRQLRGQQQSQGQQSQGQQSQAQQSQGQQAQGQQGQASQGGANTTPGMRDAAEQMRQAANDMRREDTENAARSGARAAEQLRRLEQQMRGGTADARQRAAADLRTEGQQVAQEQRRIAAEAERLEKSGEGASADARRRLAADKDRLADRIDGLKREAERLGREAGKGTEQAAARAAAGELEAQRVGERMRESAQQMRDGAAKPSGKAEQQLARTLEQAIGKLGGAGVVQTQQIAEQLERSREMREKLDRLEAQVREAQGKQDGQADTLRQQYEQELRRTRDALGRQTSNSDQRSGTGRGTPEDQELSRSAPGTEAFKQDRSGWESLRKDVNRALEEHDAAVSRRLAKALAEERLSAGGSDRVPEQYRRLVARYYESLAKTKK